jgi:hypothetical protein
MLEADFNPTTYDEDMFGQHLISKKELTTIREYNESQEVCGLTNSPLKQAGDSKLTIGTGLNSPLKLDGSDVQLLKGVDEELEQPSSLMKLDQDNNSDTEQEQENSELQKPAKKHNL